MGIAHRYSRICDSKRTLLRKESSNLFNFHTLLALNNTNLSSCVSVSLSTLDKPVARSVMRVGNSTVWNMESSRTVRCPATKPSEAVMILSTPSSAKLVLENMSLELFSWTWNLRLSMKYELEHTDNFSILNNLSLVKKMQPTTTLVDTTPLVKNLSTKCSIVYENSLINVLVSRDSSSSTPSVVVLDQDSRLC